MEKSIRRLGPEESARAEEVVRTFKGASRPAAALARYLENPANYLLVAESDGEAAGFLTAYRLERPDRGESQMFVYEVAVGEPWRGRGLAAALIQEIKRLAREEGMFEAFVLTSRANGPALRLYERTGGVVEDGAAVLFVYPFETAGAA
jgi:ribosomal protein S18 acetylase RimI-like enzyme